MLHYAHATHCLAALVDSGAIVNLIDHKLVKELQLPAIPCATPLRITAVDNQPIEESYITVHTVPIK